MRRLWFAMACTILLSGKVNAQTFSRVATLRGGGTTDFWVFNIDTQIWETLPNAPAPVGPGGAIAQRGGFIYALRGDGTQDFWQFTITLQTGSNHWESLAATPGPVGPGGSLVGINYGSEDQTARLYALQGGGSTAVWRYDVASNTWSRVADVPEPVGPGGAISAPNRYFVPGGNRGFIDVLPGNGSSSVWSYNFADGSWTRIDSAPTPVGAGGAISNLPFRCDFAFSGGGSTSFFATGPLCSAPMALANTPAPVGAGGGIAPARDSGGDYADDVYAARGGATQDFWRYRISTNAWETLLPAPYAIGDGGCVVQTVYVTGIPIAVHQRSWGEVKTLFR